MRVVKRDSGRGHHRHPAHAGTATVVAGIQGLPAGRVHLDVVALDADEVLPQVLPRLGGLLGHRVVQPERHHPVVAHRRAHEEFERTPGGHEPVVRPQVPMVLVGLGHLLDAAPAVVSAVQPVVHQQRRQREGVAHRVDQPGLARIQRRLVADVHVVHDRLAQRVELVDVLGVVVPAQGKRAGPGEAVIVERLEQAQHHPEEAGVHHVGELDRVRIPALVTHQALVRPVSPHLFVAHLLDGVRLRLGQVAGERRGVVVLSLGQRVIGVVQLIAQRRQQVLLDVGEAVEPPDGLQRQVEQIALQFEIIGREFADRAGGFAEVFRGRHVSRLARTSACHRDSGKGLS